MQRLSCIAFQKDRFTNLKDLLNIQKIGLKDWKDCFVTVQTGLRLL